MIWVFIILWILILVYNEAFGFFPESYQNILWVKILKVLSVLIILFAGIYTVIKTENSKVYAQVSSKDGSIIKSKNFSWKISKTTSSSSGNVVFIINERYGDASDVNIKPDLSVKYKIYNAMDGVGIEFFCPEKEIPDFKLVIKG